MKIIGLPPQKLKSFHCPDTTTWPPIPKGKRSPWGHPGSRKQDPSGRQCGPKGFSEPKPSCTTNLAGKPQ